MEFDGIRWRVKRESTDGPRDIYRKFRSIENDDLKNKATLFPIVSDPEQIVFRSNIDAAASRNNGAKRSENLGSFPDRFAPPLCLHRARSSPLKNTSHGSGLG